MKPIERVKSRVAMAIVAVCVIVLCCSLAIIVEKFRARIWAEEMRKAGVVAPEVQK